MRRILLTLLLTTSVTADGTLLLALSPQRVLWRSARVRA